MSKRKRKQRTSSRKANSKNIPSLRKILKKWWKEKHPVLLFAMWFVGIIVILHVLRYTDFFTDRLHPTIIQANVQGGNWLLNLLGFETQVDGSSIFSSKFDMNIVHGCDAIEAIMILIAVLLAFPSSLKQKLVGVLTGIALLTTINLIRVASLFWIGEQHHDWFEFAHIELWQFLFIILTLAFCTIWIAWSVGKLKFHKSKEKA